MFPFPWGFSPECKVCGDMIKEYEGIISIEDIGELRKIYSLFLAKTSEERHREFKGDLFEGLHFRRATDKFLDYLNQPPRLKKGLGGGYNTKRAYFDKFGKFLPN